MPLRRIVDKILPGKSLSGDASRVVYHGSFGMLERVSNVEAKNANLGESMRVTVKRGYKRETNIHGLGGVYISNTEVQTFSGRTFPRDIAQRALSELHYEGGLARARKVELVAACTRNVLAGVAVTAAALGIYNKFDDKLPNIHLGSPEQSVSYQTAAEPIAPDFSVGTVTLQPPQLSV